MSDLLQPLRYEIEEVHRFFVDWFNGTADRAALDLVFAPRLDNGFNIIAPDGTRTGYADLMAHFRGSHGVNSQIQIAIRDVEIRFELEHHVLATYSEWQTGAHAHDRSRNARISTLLVTRKQPFRWLHVHETWLPPDTLAATDGSDPAALAVG